jgi:hypothetical protein
MKTVLLFSSVFYLLGLKMGNTIEILKKIIVPVKSVISIPAEKPAQSGKTYHFKPDAISTKKEMENQKKTKSALLTVQKNAGNTAQKSSDVSVHKLPQ